MATVWLSVEHYLILWEACEENEELLRVISHNAPNWTVCPECRIDDFCHVEGCRIMTRVKE